MPRRLSALLMLCVLSCACATPRGVRLEMGEGEPLMYYPPTWDRSVEVGEQDFEESMARLLLSEPLSLGNSEAGALVRPASLSTAGDTSYWLGKALGGPCQPGQPREQCISLLDDVMGLRSWEKLTLGFGLSLRPLRESIARALDDTMTPQFFATAIGAGMVSWLLLAANPEPVFTKVAALVAAVMVVYLGVDTFLEVVKACQELRHASERAVTFEDLEAASQRFASVMGPQVARVFILAVTWVVGRGTMGGVSWLTARMPLLPHFAEASALGSAQVGLVLEQVGQVSVVTVVQGQLVISLAPTAVAMTALGSKTASASVSKSTSWGSHSGLRNALGPAGKGKQWHHLVEQTPGNVKRFGPHALHNTENVIALDEALHTQVSAFYSSKRPFITGTNSVTVREWLSPQSFEAQRAFGLRAIENIRQGLWK